MSKIKIKQLKKTYGTGVSTVEALRGIDLRIDDGEFVAIMGPSGCGKSTLLHLIGVLQSPSEGVIEIDGISVAGLSDDERTRIRRQEIGFIFQFFNLIPILSALENVALPLVLDGVSQEKANEKAKQWLERVGLSDRMSHLPAQLSGGQQQRVAVARALAHNPSFILADEPTGNLDSKSAEEITTLLRDVSEKWKKTIVMVTHDPRMSSYANRIVHLKDGIIVNDNKLA